MLYLEAWSSGSYSLFEDVSRDKQEKGISFHVTMNTGLNMIRIHFSKYDHTNGLTSIGIKIICSKTLMFALNFQK